MELALYTSFIYSITSLSAFCQVAICDAAGADPALTTVTADPASQSPQVVPPCSLCSILRLRSLTAQTLHSILLFKVSYWLFVSSNGRTGHSPRVQPAISAGVDYATILHQPNPLLPIVESSNIRSPPRRPRRHIKRRHISRL
jgi:hypothetical protein